MEKYKTGALRAIELTNFMCHESFQLALGPNVNFIIGPNGSGKSALLTAIMVAFGSRASGTSRAKRAEEFIMYGKDYAKISIVLHNYDVIMQKNLAFKPDEYGKTITVEKIIHKDEVSEQGTRTIPSKLYLRNDKGKKVSERKQELDDLLEHFGIMINNPICVLNQEVSKTFLHSKKPEDKFELFMKATNLETISGYYEAAYQHHSEWNDCNRRKTHAFKLLDHEYASCQEKVRFIENRHKLVDEKEKLHHELVWSIIKEKESSKEELDSKIQAIQKTITKSQTEISERMDKIKRHDEDIELLKAKISSIDTDMERTRKKLDSIKSKESQAKLKRIDVKQEIEKQKKLIARLTVEKDSLERSIAEQKSQYRDQNALNQENERRKLHMDRLETELPDDKARLKSLRQHNDQLGNSMTETRGQFNRANLRVNDLKTQLSQAEGALKRLKNGQTNGLKKFGDNMERILDDIERNSARFQHKPVGPLGYYVKLRTPEMAAALETHLGRNSYAFTCDNYNDMSQLTQIFRKYGGNFRQPLIITRRFRPRHNVSNYRAEHRIYKCMLDHIEVESDVAFNALVDRAGLESILYVPDYNEAENMMINPSLIPANTRCAYTRDCSAMYPRTERGGYRSHRHDSNGVLYANSNITQIREKEKEIEAIRSELREAEALAKQYGESLRVQRAEYDSNQAELRKIDGEIRKKEDQLLNYRTTLITAQQPQELQALENELIETNAKIAEANLKVDSINETLSAIEEDIRGIIRDKDDCMTVVKSQEDDRLGVLKMVENTNKSKHTFLSRIQELKLIIEHREKDKAELVKDLDTVNEQLTRSTQTSARVDNARAVDVVREELRRIDIELRNQEEDNRPPDEVLESLTKRIKEIDAMRDFKNSNLENYGDSSRALTERKCAYDRLRGNVIIQVCSTFTTIMRANSMNGVLRINLDEVRDRGQVVSKARTLEMQIDTSFTPSQRPPVMGDSLNNTSRRLSSSQPAAVAGPRTKRPRLSKEPSEKENDMGRMTDARSLSGGERSFATVAFVLSLWHHCVGPFKMMDEIDVFMDMVTRRMSYNALLRFAENQEDPGQFIFFSPLELPAIDKAQINVCVFEMPTIIRRPLQPTQAGDEAGA